MRLLANKSREEIDSMIDERLAYVMSKVMVLDTHFSSGTSGASNRTQATPRKDEFNLISEDNLLKRFEKIHDFIYSSASCFND